MEEGTITLKYGGKEFRVNPRLYRVVNEPKYKLGDKVEIIKKSLIGEIVEVNWHIKDNAPFYFIEIQGKKSGKRYKDCELRGVK